MIPSECGQLLRACSFYDNRKVTDESMVAWSKAIDNGVTQSEGVNAIAEHYAETSEWCMPSHVNNRLRVTRRERLLRAGTPPIPAGLARLDELAWSRLWCGAVKAGHPDPVLAANTAMRIPSPAPLSDGWIPDRLALVAKLAESKGIPAQRGTS